MSKTITADLSWQPLGEIACLLQSTADHLWEAADAAGLCSTCAGKLGFAPVHDDEGSATP